MTDTDCLVPGPRLIQSGRNIGLVLGFDKGDELWPLICISKISPRGAVCSLELTIPGKGGLS